VTVTRLLGLVPLAVTAGGVEVLRAVTDVRSPSRRLATPSGSRGGW
jgi:hypothetical protein